jgi:uncharacterized membrane protein
MDSQLKKSTYVGLNITIHIIILFSFLSLFFFLYVSKVEQDAFKSEIGNLIEENMYTILEDHKDTIKPMITNANEALIVLKNEYAQPESVTSKQNSFVKFTAGFTILMLLGICISITLTLMVDCKKKVPLWPILLENTITFLLVGVIEFLFFTKIAVKYVPAPPTLMLKTIFQTFASTFN